MNISHFSLYQALLFACIMLSAPNSSAAERPEIDLAYFRNSYEESKQQFLASVASLRLKLPDAKINEHSFSSPSDKNLTTDTAWIKTKNMNTHLKVIISGVHGIEGYVGSALQSWMLQQQIMPDSASDYLFIHALNPYGFKNNRRVNESNIDLNRNFVLTPAQFLAKNKSYEKIYSFLNPSQPAQVNWLSPFTFILSSVRLILGSSMEHLRQAILVGQYQFPKGISYGGDKPQYQSEIINKLFEDIIKKYARVFIADLHTAYGKKNKLHLFANSEKKPSSSELIRIFSKDRIDFGDQQKFYTATGDLISYLEAKSQPNNTILGIVFELGTMDSQKTLGSIESLRRIILENQKFNYRSDNLDSAESIDLLFRDLFYPQNDLFKKSALSQMQQVLRTLGDSF